MAQVNEVHDAIIVGAGPVGSYAAYRLAESGLDVVILDRKKAVGEPVQCAGLVNSSMFDLKGLGDLFDDVVLRRIKGADLFSPSGQCLPLRGKEVKALSIDRSRLDKKLFRKAVGAGAEPRLGVEVSGIEGSMSDTVRTRSGDVLKGGLVLGCDGPASIARNSLGLDNPTEVIPGVSMECAVHRGEIPDDRVCVMTGNDVARGFFAWAIPSFQENGIRLGLSTLSGKDLRKGMNNLMRDSGLASYLSLEGPEDIRISTISVVYGSVPMGVPGKIHSGRTLLLGDSAGMAKPTSGGGIFPGLRAADLLTDVVDGIGFENESVIASFRKGWDVGYGRELSRSMVLRRIIRELPDKDIERAVDALNDQRKLELINSTGDIDHPIQLAVRLLRTDPRLLGLIPRYIPHLRSLLRR